MRLLFPAEVDGRAVAEVVAADLVEEEAAVASAAVVGERSEREEVVARNVMTERHS